MLSDTYQKQYDFEHQQRSELTSALNSPVVAVTVMASAIAVALLDFPYSESSGTKAFASVTATTLLSLGISMFFIFRSSWNYEYQKLAPAPKLAEHYRLLIDWHRAQVADAALAKQYAENDFREYIGTKLSEAAEWNGKNNLRRGNFLHMATTALAIALIFFIPAALLYSYAKATAPDKVHKITLTNPLPSTKEFPMSESKPQNAPSSTPSTAPAKPQVTPTISQSKPVGPPNTTFRTNTELPPPQASGTIPGVKK